MDMLTTLKEISDTLVDIRAGLKDIRSIMLNTSAPVSDTSVPVKTGKTLFEQWIKSATFHLDDERFLLQVKFEIALQCHVLNIYYNDRSKIREFWFSEPPEYDGTIYDPLPKDIIENIINLTFNRFSPIEICEYGKKCSLCEKSIWGRCFSPKQCEDRFHLKCLVIHFKSRSPPSCPDCNVPMIDDNIYESYLSQMCTDNFLVLL